MYVNELGRAFHIEPEALHEVVGTVRDGFNHWLKADMRSRRCFFLGVVRRRMKSDRYLMA
jgi:hypothetical protein